MYSCKICHEQSELQVPAHIQYTSTRSVFVVLTAFCPVGWLHTIDPGIPSSKCFKKRLQDVFNGVPTWFCQMQLYCSCHTSIAALEASADSKWVGTGEGISLVRCDPTITRLSFSWGLACINKYISEEDMLGVTGQNFTSWHQSLCYNAEWKELEHLVQDSEDGHRWQLSMEQYV